MFEACLHTKNCLKLSSPKINNELRTRLIRQAKDQKNVRVENGRRILRDNIRVLEGSKADTKQIRRTKTYLDEIFNHFKKQSDLMYKEKDANLKEDFDL